MTDITERLEERAVSYEQSGPSAHHTAALLREAKNEIEHLRSALETIAGSAKDKLQAIQARQALPNIGPRT